jgi:hypothetical protein
MTAPGPTQVGGDLKGCGGKPVWGLAWFDDPRCRSTRWDAAAQSESFRPALSGHGIEAHARTKAGKTTSPSVVWSLQDFSTHVAKHDAVAPPVPFGAVRRGSHRETALCYMPEAARAVARTSHGLADKGWPSLDLKPCCGHRRRSCVPARPVFDRTRAVRQRSKAGGRATVAGAPS